MGKPGRPTSDPKALRISMRLAERDIAALDVVARRRGLTISEAARTVLREALGVPLIPRSKRNTR